jgi:hypothetical protein
VDDGNNHGVDLGSKQGQNFARFRSTRAIMELRTTGYELFLQNFHLTRSRYSRPTAIFSSHEGAGLKQ